MQDGIFIKIKSSLRKKKLHRTNQGPNFLEGSFSNRYNERTPIQEKETVNLSILAPELLGQMKPVEFFHQ